MILGILDSRDASGGREDAITGLPADPVVAPQLAEDQLAIFRRAYPTPPMISAASGREGKSPKEWYAGGPSEKPPANLDRFGDGLNRSSLIALQADRSVPTFELSVAILAWGGMHGSNRAHLFKRPVAPWLDVAQHVRDGRLTRRGAFDRFAALNHDGSLVGMGPAYYTKLIYFLMPRTALAPIGYIMDQWLGCSINLMCWQHIVRMDNMIVWERSARGRSGTAVQKANSRVSPLNTGEQYERFCLAIESIAAHLEQDWTPDAVELALMSRGGRRPAAWRAHVVQSRLLRVGL